MLCLFSPIPIIQLFSHLSLISWSTWLFIYFCLPTLSSWPTYIADTLAGSFFSLFILAGLSNTWWFSSASSSLSVSHNFLNILFLCSAPLFFSIYQTEHRIIFLGNPIILCITVPVMGHVIVIATPPSIPDSLTQTMTNPPLKNKNHYWVIVP